MMNGYWLRCLIIISQNRNLLSRSHDVQTKVQIFNTLYTRIFNFLLLSPVCCGLNEFACSWCILSDRSCRWNQHCLNWRSKCLYAGIGWSSMEQCGSITVEQTNQTKCWSLNSTSYLMDWPCSEWARGTSTLSSGSVYDEISCYHNGPVYCKGLAEGRPLHLSWASEETWMDWCLGASTPTDCLWLSFKCVYVQMWLFIKS